MLMDEFRRARLHDLGLWDEPGMDFEGAYAKAEAVFVILVADLLELIDLVIAPERREFDLDS
jgi:hypothetical protein